MKWAVIGLAVVSVLATALFFLLRWVDGRSRRSSARRTEAEVNDQRASVLKEKQGLSDQEALEEWQKNTSGGSP